MPSHLIYLPPRDSDLNPETDFEVVTDSKSYLALLVPPLWLLTHRLWMAFFAYVILIIAAALFLAWRPVASASWLLSIPGLYFWLEGSRHLARRLERKGWRFAAVVDADNKETAVVKWIIQQSQEKSALPAPSARMARPPHVQTTPAGLFPE